MSNTIIMYENGKAIGGEGHPTYASDITFDNTGTDLVSEDVESAIKEVNAKSAKSADLTSISESGTTASQAISAGTYFYLNGTLVRAKTDIASGATFTLNTNYKIISEGVLNRLVVLEVHAESSGLSIPLPSGTIDQWSILSCYYYTSTRGFPAISVNDNTYPTPYLHSTSGIVINAASNMPSSTIRIVLYKFD